LATLVDTERYSERIAVEASKVHRALWLEKLE
jgi:hypothetical protein